MKSFVLFALLFCSAVVRAGAVGTNSSQEKCASGLSDDNPFRLELYRSQASANLLAALRAGLLKPSKKYWTEIRCLDSNSNGQAETLQRVLRDYVAFSKSTSSSFGYYTTFRTVLDFLQATSQPESVYALLVDELKENDLVLDNALIFDALISIKEQFGLGQDSPLLRDVPKAVQQIAMQGKQIRLKNNVTGRYLVLNSNSEFVSNGLNTFTLSDQAINAGMGNNATTFDFKPVKMPAPSTTSTSTYGQSAGLYTFELQQHGAAAACSTPALNCSAGSSSGSGNDRMLTVRGFARSQTYDPSYTSQRYRISNFSQFTLQAHEEDVISIELSLDRVFEKHVLAELPDGTVGIVIRGSTIIDGQPITGLKSYWMVEV